jgi:hypothetical protein
MIKSFREENLLPLTEGINLFHIFDTPMYSVSIASFSTSSGVAH